MVSATPRCWSEKSAFFPECAGLRDEYRTSRTQWHISCCILLSWLWPCPNFVIQVESASTESTPVDGTIAPRPLDPSQCVVMSRWTRELVACCRCNRNSFHRSAGEQMERDVGPAGQAVHITSWVVWSRRCGYYERGPTTDDTLEGGGRQPIALENLC